MPALKPETTVKTKWTIFKKDSSFVLVVLLCRIIQNIAKGKHNHSLPHSVNDMICDTQCVTQENVVVLKYNLFHI